MTGGGDPGVAQVAEHEGSRASRRPLPSTFPDKASYAARISRPSASSTAISAVALDRGLRETPVDAAPSRPGCRIAPGHVGIARQRVADVQIGGERSIRVPGPAVAGGVVRLIAGFLATRKSQPDARTRMGAMSAMVGRACNPDTADGRTQLRDRLASACAVHEMRVHAHAYAPAWMGAGASSHLLRLTLLRFDPHPDCRCGPECCGPVPARPDRSAHRVPADRSAGQRGFGSTGCVPWA